MAGLFERQQGLVTTSHADMSAAFEQAIALVAGQLQVSAFAARRCICSHGYRTGRPVHDIARDVVSNRLEFAVQDLG